MLKVTSTNALLVLLRMFFSLGSQKVFAVLLGADGIAQIGSLRNVISFFEKFSVLGASNGLVKFVAQYKNDKTQLNNLFSTIFILSAFSAVFSFIILFFWSNSLNTLVFGRENDFAYLFKVLSFMVPFMGINLILNSLLNGCSDYKSYTKISLTTIVFGTGLIVFFTFKKGINGSLLAISVIPVLQFFTYLFFFPKGYKNYLNFSKLKFVLSFKNKLLSYSFMSIFVVFSINFADIAVRNLIEYKIGIAEAGYWTAMTSISKAYMQFTAAIFPLYILPRYSKVTNTFDFRVEVKKIYKMLLPIVFIGMLLVFLFRNFIVKTLYSSDFLLMSNLFKWQLMGDLTKFLAIVVSYQFLAKRQIINYIITELFAVVCFYVFSIYFIDSHGIEGIVMAHFARYVLYFLLVLYILRNSLLGKNKSF